MRQTMHNNAKWCVVPNFYLGIVWDFAWGHHVQKKISPMSVTELEVTRDLMDPVLMAGKWGPLRCWLHFGAPFLRRTCGSGQTHAINQPFVTFKFGLMPCSLIWLIWMRLKNIIVWVTKGVHQILGMGLGTAAPLVPLTWLLANQPACLYSSPHLTGFLWAPNEIPRGLDSCCRKSSHVVKNTRMLILGLRFLWVFVSLSAEGGYVGICRSQGAVCVLHETFCVNALYTSNIIIDSDFPSRFSRWGSFTFIEPPLPTPTQPSPVAYTFKMIGRISGVVCEGEIEWNEKNHKRPPIHGLDFIKQVQYSSMWSPFSQMQPLTFSQLSPAVKRWGPSQSGGGEPQAAHIADHLRNIQGL